jgi:hypothetical protein
MAITGTQLIMTLEGVTSNVLTGGGILYPQSISGWLRAMKENVQFHARNIGETMVLGIFGSLSATEEAVSTGAINVLGFVGQNTDSVANLIVLENDQTSGMGAVITHLGATYYKAAAATTPVQVGVVWFPYNTIFTELAMAGVGVDMTTLATANTLKCWMVYAP